MSSTVFGEPERARCVDRGACLSDTFCFEAEALTVPPAGSFETFVEAVGAVGAVGADVLY
jgi:hypothetical protein